MTSTPAPPERTYYQCERCTACCRWPGFVRLGDGEAERIAAYLGMSVHDFIQRYMELLPSRQALGIISRPNHECIFLEGNDCAIQAVKPRQCAGFPNTWNFTGWRDICHARELRLPANDPRFDSGTAG
ncbi:zinc/iron-chelating domain-containing protein [Verrucomicrobia bacterium LW23]|nr:zinc/iron-chelating domain-containing protein [Verrucomicrobia bacterium LW23]